MKRIFPRDVQLILIVSSQNEDILGGGIYHMFWWASLLWLGFWSLSHISLKFWWCPKIQCLTYIISSLFVQITPFFQPSLTTQPVLFWGGVWGNRVGVGYLPGGSCESTVRNLRHWQWQQGLMEYKFMVLMDICSHSCWRETRFVYWIAVWCCGGARFLKCGVMESHWVVKS